MATIKELKELALHAARGTAPAEYTASNVDEALRGELAQMCSSINNFMRNRYDIYDIIIETADEIVPTKVIDVMGTFAEIKSVPQGQKAIFKRGLIGRNRAKKFLTQVGLSGVYETFRLDNETFELGGHAIGGAAAIDFERFLDGAENMADLMDIITEGLSDAVFGEVQRLLIEAAGKMIDGSNKVSSASFEADKMVKLINTVKAYGGSAVIFAAPEFIGAMGADAIVPVIAGAAQGVYHPDDIDAIHKTGKIKIFRGTPVVEIPQSFVDETNKETVINPQYAYVLPSGKEKVVKVVFEGNTQVRDLTNADGSMEIHTYKKMGAAILTYHNWGIYQNTGITDTSEFPYGV